MALKEKIKQNPALKQAVHRFIMHPVKTRPNWWIRTSMRHHETLDSFR